MQNRGQYCTVNVEMLVAKNHLYRKLEKLINQPNINKGTSAIKSLHTIAESVHKRSLIVLFSLLFVLFLSGLRILQ